MCHTVPFYTEVDSQIAHKMPVLRYPVDTAHGMLHCKTTYPLLMNCFKPFLRCIEQREKAFASIYEPLMGLIAPFSIQMALKLHTKYDILGTLSVQ